MNRVGERRIYILDHSASMQAVEGGTSRLEQARQKALRLLQDASSDDVAMVISTSDRAMVEQGFTNNKGLLEKAIQRIEATNHTTEVSEAFRVASGLANPGRASFEDNVDIQVADAVPATVYFLSDGAVGPLDESEFGQLKIEYVPIGEQDTPNVAVLGFAVQRPEGASGGSLGGASDKIEVFAVTSNQGDQPVEATASLYHQEQLIDAQKISIPARQESACNSKFKVLTLGVLNW